MGMVVVEGIEDVVKAMGRADERVKSATLRGMKRWAAKVIFDAQVNLRQNGSVVTDLLRASGHVNAPNGREEITFGFFNTENDKGGYAAAVEFGRRAGGWTFKPRQKGQKREKGKKEETRSMLVKSIKTWLKKKDGLSEGPELDSRAFLVARSIVLNGTKPHPYFQPAIDKNRASYGTTIKDEVSKVLKG